MRTVYEVRLMMKVLLPMPPAFCAPVHAVVGRTIRHRLPCPAARRLNDIVAPFLAVDDGLGFSGDVKTVLSFYVYLEVVFPF